MPTSTLHAHSRVALFFLAAAALALCLWQAATFNNLPPLSSAPVPVPLPSTPLPIPPTTTPTIPAPPTPTLPPPDIVIDPGHGGTDPGRLGKDGQHEKKWALAVGQALATQLRASGWKVSLTRDADTTVSLLDRSTFANQRPRLLLVSIHFNSGESAASGLETYFSWPRQPELMAKLHAAAGLSAGAPLPPDDSAALAASIQQAACAATNSRNRGTHNRPNLSVTSRTLAPAVLVECGFLTHPDEADNIRSSSWRTKLVKGLASGITSWLAASGKSPSSSPPSSDIIPGP
jgi:N-acetylmuramoyl-L-alanine amidase